LRPRPSTRSAGGWSTGCAAGGQHEEAAALTGSRWALLKNPSKLTGDQRATLVGIVKANGGLYRAYLLKEQLRAIFQAVALGDARALLGGWVAVAAPLSSRAVFQAG